MASQKTRNYIAAQGFRKIVKACKTVETISNKQTNEWEAAEVADIKVFVTELSSYYSEASKEDWPN